MHRAAVILGFWSASLAIYDVLQKQAFRFIDWLVALDFCGRRRSIRTEKECSGIWRLTRLRLESRQVVSNQPAPTPTLGLESGNQTTSSQGPANPPVSNQPAPAPTLSLSLEIKLRQAKARPTKEQIGNGMRYSN